VSDLLIVEDDETIAAGLADALRSQGHQVRVQPTAAGALAECRAAPPELVLLDLGLPDLDGVELCRRLRRVVPQAVVVVLTARTDEVDVVVSLDAGADDYLTKPVRLGELLARVRAHLRRPAAGPDTADVLQVGVLQMDTAARRVTVDGVEVPLRSKEYELLGRLIRDVGRAVSRDTLMRDVWDAHWYGSSKTLDVHVASLRRRLAATSPAAPTITTLRGHGYRLDGD
jgi:DNA-binding response OmpR family regulator